MGNCVSDKLYNSIISQNFAPGSLDLRIHWDAPDTILKIANGEHVFAAYNDVEDARGSNGLGSLTITNLRIIWIHEEQKHLSISIGLGTVSYIHFNMIKTKIYGRCRAPHIMTQYHDNRYDFTFVGKNDLNMKIFQFLDTTARRFRATRLFRNVFTRDVESNQAGPGPIYYGETLADMVQNCRLLKTGMKRDGNLYITNRRLIFISQNGSKAYTASIPFINIKSIRMKKAFYGLTITINLNNYAGSYSMCFPKKDSQEVSDLVDDLTKLHQESMLSPFYGPVDGKIQYEDNQFIIIAPTSIGESINTTNNQEDTSIMPVNDYNFANAPFNLKEENETGDTNKAVDIAVQCPLLSITSTNILSSFDDSDTIEKLTSDKNSYLVISDEHRHRDQDTTQCSSQADDIFESKISNAEQKMIVAAAAILQANSNLSKSAIQYGRNMTSLTSHSSKLIRRCIICAYEESEVAFDPCGHICSCKGCATKMQQCPVCRSQVQKSLKIYF